MIVVCTSGVCVDFGGEDWQFSLFFCGGLWIGCGGGGGCSMEAVVEICCVRFGSVLDCGSCSELLAVRLVDRAC
jgi:hypothetical protein